MQNLGVCLLNDSFPPLIDGVANTVLNYARVLNQEGSRPYVLTPQYPGADDSLYPYEVIRYAGLDTRKMLGYVAGYPFSARVAQELEGKKIDLIHTHCPFASAVLARSIREIIPAPLVFTYHTKFGYDIRKLVKSKIIQDSALKLIASNIKSCDEVWVVSKGAGRDMCEILGQDIEYRVMDNGVDLPRERVPEAEMRELLKEYMLPEGIPVFLFVGRMMWYKGIRISLEALAGVSSQNKNFRMVFVGGGADEEEIKKTAQELGILDKCIFCGKIYDRRKLQAWYSRADLFLFPSTYDTNGLVVREAAACSLASVLVAGSCAAEQTTPDHNCFQITESPASMAALLMRIMDNRELMKKAGENAAKELYLSWDQAVKRAIDRYGVIDENYGSGIYKKRHSLSTEYIKMNAEIMETFSSIYNAIDFFQKEDKGDFDI